MNVDLRHASVSYYGIVVSGSDSISSYVDFFVPELMLKQLELRPGALAIVQGMSPTAREFFLRARSGLGNVVGRTPFVAAVRFANKPKVLHRFLTLARERDIQFQAIRTFGYRADDASEVVFEGSVPDREQHFVYRHGVKAYLDQIVADLSTSPRKRKLDGVGHDDSTDATKAQGGDDVDEGDGTDATKAQGGDDVDDGDGQEAYGEVVSHEILRFHETLDAHVSSTVYRIEVPLLRDRFLKVRVRESLSSPTTALLPEGRLALARLGLDLTSMTLTISTDLNPQNHYVLVFRGRDLANAPPVTNKILEALPASVNVDAISAYEYMGFDPESAKPEHLTPLGRIDMLCVTREWKDLDVANVEARVRAVLEKELGDPARLVELTIQPIAEYFDELRASLAARRDGPAPPADAKVGMFNEVLNDRYVQLEEFLGSGAFGHVYKYLDLLSHEMVAGKHFPKERVGSREIKALIQNRQASKNLLDLRDFFFYDDVPVIVTEFLPITLGNHESNSHRDKRAIPHLRPRNLREFALMARQICKGLHDLHERGHVQQATPSGFVHGDVKPANIGATVVDGKLTWKLIDFGLARQYGPDRQSGTDAIGGTPLYISPQVLAGEPASPSDDIFALGVTFFEVLCDWTHPTDPTATAGIGNWPAEVNRYFMYLGNAPGNEPSGYDRERWKLGRPFIDEKLPQAASDQLRDIVFAMMAMSTAKRPSSAAAVDEMFREWAGRYNDVLLR